MNMSRVIGTGRVDVSPAYFANSLPAFYVPFQKLCDLIRDAEDRSEQVPNGWIFSHLPLTLPHFTAGAFAALRAVLSFCSYRVREPAIQLLIIRNFECPDAVWRKLISGCLNLIGCLRSI